MRVIRGRGAAIYRRPGSIYLVSILKLLDDLGYFSASLYLPFSIAGIETIGAEIMEQAKAQAGRQPDVVLVTHAGGGNLPVLQEACASPATPERWWAFPSIWQILTPMTMLYLPESLSPPGIQAMDSHPFITRRAWMYR
mgnify:CR=1 FL=1